MDREHALFLSPLIVQFMAANTAMQGAYIPQYAHMQTSAVPVEVRALTASQPDVCKTLSSFKTAAHCWQNGSGKELRLFSSLFQENGAQSQVDSSGNHSPYSYQQTK